MTSQRILAQRTFLIRNTQMPLKPKESVEFVSGAESMLLITRNTLQSRTKYETRAVTN